MAPAQGPQLVRAAAAAAAAMLRRALVAFALQRTAALVAPRRRVRGAGAPPRAAELSHAVAALPDAAAALQHAFVTADSSLATAATVGEAADAEEALGAIGPSEGPHLPGWVAGG